MNKNGKLKNFQPLTCEKLAAYSPQQTNNICTPIAKAELVLNIQRTLFSVGRIRTARNWRPSGLGRIHSTRMRRVNKAQKVYSLLIVFNSCFNLLLVMFLFYI